MTEKLKIHDGNTQGKVFEVKPEYTKPKVATMSDIYPITLTRYNDLDEVGLIDANQMYQIYSTEEDIAQELIHTRKALEIAIQYIKHTQSVEPFWFNRLANKTLNKIKTTLKQKD